VSDLPTLGVSNFSLKMAVFRQNSIRPVFSIIYSGHSPLVAMMQRVSSARRLDNVLGVSSRRAEETRSFCSTPDWS
jgi:hypothetical protein